MRPRLSAACILAAIFMACTTPPLENTGPPQRPPCNDPPDFFPGLNRSWEKADILFVIDNSTFMEGMASELRNRIPAMLDAFRQAADRGVFIDAHFGVITTDYGAGSTGAPGCSQSPGGQQGRLQALGAKAPQNCKKPTGGVNFVAYRWNDWNNLPPGHDLAETLQCMMSVGDSGCGFEHPLEAARAALHNDLPENVGFLREEAMLAVLFFTNEDDASAPPDTDIFDKNKVMQYGYMNSYSRQTRFAIQCCPPGRQSCNPDELQFPPYGDSSGPLAGCRPAPNPDGDGPGKQYDVSRYIDFFTRIPAMGGVKLTEDDVLLAAIDGPESPFRVTLQTPTPNRGTCFALDEAANPPCVPLLDHSCVHPNFPFYGDPAIRLNTVVRAAKNHAIGSICDDYSSVLRAVAAAVIARAEAPHPPEDAGCN